MEETLGKSYVTRSTHGAVAVVSIENPPVNAMNTAVRRGLLSAVEAADRDDDIQAILLIGSGNNFIAGADLREFGQPPQLPSLPEVCDRIEMCRKPVIAAVNGATLGGGLEVALSAHYRLANIDAKLGLPEVNLGLIPGAGGTQRLPRLIGARLAIDLMLSGRHLNAQAAEKIGLIDCLSTVDDMLAAGLQYCQELIEEHARVRRARDQSAPGTLEENLAAVAASRAGGTDKFRSLFAPWKVLDAIEAAFTTTFDAGSRIERKLFLECKENRQHSALVHAFFAEREVAKIPTVLDATPRKVVSVGIVGGGTMGAGIAVSVLDAGLSVTMIERDAASLERGRTYIKNTYEALIKKGRMTADRLEQKMARFAGSTSYDALSSADLVIEAVFEQLDAKITVFQELDRVCKPGAIMATNTSYLDIDAIAANTTRSRDVVGLHFFSPANVMRLLEIVVTNSVSPDVVATAFALAKRLKKVPVRATVCDGFIGNRILAVYRAAVDHMMEDGASPYQIDKALRDFGFPMGPFQVTDLAGGDIGWATRKRRATTRDPEARYVQIADRLCERGWFGQKTGRGFYRYPEGSRNGVPDSEVEEIITAERERASITPRAFSDTEIVRRYMAAMINESANVVHQGVALRPLDVDVTLLHGYGFPRYRGGPMKYADSVGLANVLADIREFAQEDPLFWQPSPLIVDLVERDADFNSLNRSA